MSEVTEEEAERIHQLAMQQLWGHPETCKECQRTGFGCDEWKRLAEVKKKWLAIKVNLQMIRDGLV